MSFYFEARPERVYRPRPTRPQSVMGFPLVHVGTIPRLTPEHATVSSAKFPCWEAQRRDFLMEKRREETSIQQQAYRTTPLIQSQPKTARDWPTGSYLRLPHSPDAGLSRPMTPLNYARRPLLDVRDSPTYQLINELERQEHHTQQQRASPWKLR